MIVIAGATGNLGSRVVRELRQRGVRVRALVRPGTAQARVEKLTEQGVEVVEVNLKLQQDLIDACSGASCIVSTLLGLRATMIDAQNALLEAAIAAGVPRFIPSDYCLDYKLLTPGMNRNLDLHREFKATLDRAPIHSTTILNGAFMNLLAGEAPLVLFKINRVLYWGEGPTQLMDFTTMDNVAAFAAETAIDSTTPPILRIAGEQISAEGLRKLASEVTGKEFKLLRGGSLKRLERIFKLTRALTPRSNAPFPIWQGMQYLYSMFEGHGKLSSLDNDRYPHLRWTNAREMLSSESRGKQ